VSFELIILGSSSALPTSRRFTAAHLLNVNERFFLIDCGEGTQIQLRRNKISPARIHHIFISHLHGDHVFGLFGLISSLGLLGRKAALNIYSPPGMQEMLDDHLKYFGPAPFEIRIHTPDPGALAYENSRVAVHTLALNHRKPTYGYLFREKPRLLNIYREKIEEYGLGIEDIVKIKNGADHVTSDGRVIPNSELTLRAWKQRSYAYISDTAFNAEVAGSIEGVDLLFHESTFLDRDRGLAEETFHSTARQAAEFAKIAGAGQLLIGHFSTRYKNEEAFLAEARELFPQTEAVNDDDRFVVVEERTAPPQE
jgi:ribonuclease Z